MSILEEKTEDEKKGEPWLGTTIGSVVLIMIILALVMLTVLQITDWDFSKSGSVGDMIGGLSAPFINLLGAFLVYRSFLIQKDANQLQFKALEEEKKRRDAEREVSFLYDRLKELKTDILNFTYGSYIGANALVSYSNQLETCNTEKQIIHHFQNSSFGVYWGLFTSFYNIEESVESAQIPHKDKEFLFGQLEFIYHSWLFQSAFLIEEWYSKQAIKQFHELPGMYLIGRIVKSDKHYTTRLKEWNNTATTGAV